MDVDRHTFRPLIWVDPKDLKVDRDYQRATRKYRARKIADEFDARLFDPITVAVRNGKDYWVIDGAHRVEACRLLGMDKIPAFRADTLTQQEEARLFSVKNKTTKMPTAAETFKADLVAGTIDAVEIQKTADVTGWEVDGDLRCLGTLRNCHKWYGINSIEKGLSVLRGAVQEGDTVQVELVHGTAAFFFTWPEADVDRTAMILRKKILGILGKVQASGQLGSGNRGTVAAAVIKDTYNAGLRSRKLPDRQVPKK